MHTTTQAAARLNCSRRTVQRWCERESIGTKAGRDWLLTDADVARLALLVQPSAGNPNFGRAKTAAPSASTAATSRQRSR